MALGTLDFYYVKVTYCQEDFSGEEYGDWFNWKRFRVASHMHHAAAVKLDMNLEFKERLRKEVIDKFDSTILVSYDVTTPVSQLGMNIPESSLYEENKAHDEYLPYKRKYRR